MVEQYFDFILLFKIYYPWFKRAKYISGTQFYIFRQNLQPVIHPPWPARHGAQQVEPSVTFIKDIINVFALSQTSVKNNSYDFCMFLKY